MTDLVWYDDSNGAFADLNRERARGFGYRYLFITSAGVPGIVKIVRTPDTCAGHPRIDGRRMTIHDIVCYVQLYEKKLDCYNEAIEKVAAEFPDYPEHIVRAVMQWYDWSTDHKREIDRILEERRRDYETLEEGKAYYDPCQVCCPFGLGECQGHVMTEEP